MTPRTRRKTAPSLLILQVDSHRIKADGLDMTAVARGPATISSLFSSARCKIAETTNLDSFQRLVRDAADQGRWDVVVIIGHSNAHGLKIASDRFSTWEEVGAELKPLKPRRLVLIACKGGRASGANALFRKLRDLRRIYACPVNCSKDLGKVMLGLVPVAVENKAPRRRLIRYAQGLTALSVGGQLRHWARNEDKDNPHGQLFDILADLIDPQVRGLRLLLTGLLR